MTNSTDNDFDPKDDLQEIDTMLSDFFQDESDTDQLNFPESRQDEVLRKINHQVGVVSLIGMFSAWAWVVLAAIGLNKPDSNSVSHKMTNKTD